MKIFNWVNRRLLHAVHCSTGTLLHHGLGFKKNADYESENNEAETKALLGHGSGLLLDPTDGWEDGSILAIGTFGLDHLMSLNGQKECAITSNEEEADDDDAEKEDEKETASINDSASEGHNVASSISNIVSSELENNEKSCDMMMLSLNGGGGDVLDESKPLMGSPDFTSAPEWDMNGSEVSKGDHRITLADLFLADSDCDSDHHIPKKKHQNQDDNGPGKKKNPGLHDIVKRDSGLSAAKKLILKTEEERRPIRSLHRLMKRMMKRKIHPELEAKTDTPMTDERTSSAAVQVPVASTA